MTAISIKNPFKSHDSRADLVVAREHSGASAAMDLSEKDGSEQERTRS